MLQLIVQQRVASKTTYIIHPKNNQSFKYFPQVIRYSIKNNIQ